MDRTPIDRIEDDLGMMPAADLPVSEFANTPAALESAIERSRVASNVQDALERHIGVLAQAAQTLERSQSAIEHHVNSPDADREGGRMRPDVLDLLSD